MSFYTYDTYRSTVETPLNETKRAGAIWITKILVKSIYIKELSETTIGNVKKFIITL